MSSLLSDVGIQFFPHDASRLRSFASDLAARDRATPSTRCPQSIAWAWASVDTIRPPALGMAFTSLERVADGARDRQTGHRHRVASARVPTVLDVEKPS